MKQILIKGEPSTYYIFEDGRVLNKKTGRYYKGSIRGGYRWFDLRWNGSKYTYSQHRLIAEYFLENKNNLPIVHHKDHNKLNNSIDNLEWVSYSENNLKINKTENKKTIIDHYYCEDDEKWISYKDTIYLISSYGRVKNSLTKKILKGKISSVGYLEYCLLINKKSKTILAHRLTYSAFNPSEEIIVINHIDGNKLNNCIDNLENISYKENNLKAIYETKTNKFKRTVQYDKEMNIIQIFMNNEDAARFMNVRPQSIQRAIAQHGCSCGYYWDNID